MSTFMEGLVTIILAIVTVGLVAVLVSKNAQTPQVAQAFFSGIGNTLGVAESPVTGANINFSLGYPGANNFGTAFGF